MKKYSRLYNDLKEQIITGQLAHGDKIPSVRKAALIYSVSTTTVQNAYFELCADGYIVSKEKAVILYHILKAKIKSKMKQKMKQILNIILTVNALTRNALMYRFGRNI